MDDIQHLQRRVAELETQVAQLKKAFYIFAAVIGLLAVCASVPSIGNVVGFVLSVPLAIAISLACLYAVWWFLENAADANRSTTAEEQPAQEKSPDHRSGDSPSQ